MQSADSLLEQKDSHRVPGRYGQKFINVYSGLEGNRYPLEIISGFYIHSLYRLRASHVKKLEYNDVHLK